MTCGCEGRELPPCDRSRGLAVLARGPLSRTGRHDFGCVFYDLVMKAIGPLLIVAGIASFAWGIFHGGIRFSIDPLSLAPIAGGVCVLAGVVVLVASSKSSKQSV